MSNLPTWKKVLIVTAVLLAAFFILDFNYFLANLKFIFHKPQTAQTSKPPAPAGQKMEPNLLLVDSLDIKVPIVYVNEKTETAYQAALINGVVHFPGTANPGQLGNCYIFGHSSDYIWSKGKYKSIFAVLPSIKKGAEIVISDPSGNKYVYTVISSAVVAANDTSVLDQQNYAKKLLTLQTSYPVGTALQRFVAVAEMK